MMARYEIPHVNFHETDRDISKMKRWLFETVHISENEYSCNQGFQYSVVMLTMSRFSCSHCLCCMSAKNYENWLTVLLITPSSSATVPMAVLGQKTKNMGQSHLLPSSFLSPYLSPLPFSLPPSLLVTIAPLNPARDMGSASKLYQCAQPVQVWSSVGIL